MCNNLRNSTTMATWNWLISDDSIAQKQQVHRTRRKLKNKWNKDLE